MFCVWIWNNGRVLVRIWVVMVEARLGSVLMAMQKRKMVVKIMKIVMLMMVMM